MTLHEIVPLAEAATRTAPRIDRTPLPKRRPRLSAQDLFSMLIWFRRQHAAPRVKIRMSVYTPNGRAAVEVRLGS